MKDKNVLKNYFICISSYIGKASGIFMIMIISLFFLISNEKVYAASSNEVNGITIRVENIYCEECKENVEQVDSVVINKISGGVGNMIAIEFTAVVHSCIYDHLDGYSVTKNIRIEGFDCNATYDNQCVYESLEVIGRPTMKVYMSRKPGHKLTVTSHDSFREKHTGKCDLCNAYGITESCSGGTATCVSKAVCSVCNNQYGRINSSNHNYGNVVLCQNNAICIDCEEEYISKGHVYENGFCKFCDIYEVALLNDNDTPDDTLDDYYEIANAGNLYWFAAQVNGGTVDINATLTDNIVVNKGVMTAQTVGARSWTPIGEFDSENDTEYRGIFDGNGKTISGLYFSETYRNFVGLFGAIDNAVVKNVGIINSYIYGTADVAAISGNVQNSQIMNCYNSSIICAEIYAGGIAGRTTESTITNCYNTGNMYILGENGLKIFNIAYTIDDYAIENCYYLSESETEHMDGVTSKTAQQFASGEVTYLLQNNQSGEIWGQAIGKDDYPNLGGPKVHFIKNCIGNDVYSNQSEDYSHDYGDDGICKLCGYVDRFAKVVGCTISLSGNIGVNFHMAISNDVPMDGTANMVFLVPNEQSGYEVRIPITEQMKEGKYYVFTCEVAAKEMSSDIKAWVETQSGNSEEFTYSVREYAEYILASTDAEYSSAKPLVKKMLNYGAYVQKYFNYNTENLANVSLDLGDKMLPANIDLSEYVYNIEYDSSDLTGNGQSAEPECIENQEIEQNITFYGASLSLKSETAINLYFELKDGVDVGALDVTVNGNTVDIVKNGNYYEIKISDIPVHKLSSMYEIKVGNLTLIYGVFSYGSMAMDGDNSALKNVIKAIYCYNQEAMKFIS